MVTRATEPYTGEAADSTPPADRRQARRPIGSAVARSAARVRVALQPVTSWLWRRPDLLVCGAYILLSIWANARQWIRPYTRVNGHLATDNIQFYWWLEHGAYTLRHFTNPFFSERMNAPDGVNMMANTSVLGITLPLSPITLLFGAQISYVVYVSAALAGSSIAAYYVLKRHVVTSRVAAAIGGVFWGFAPGMIHHANGQPNFISNFLIPLIVLTAFRLGEPGRTVRRGVTLGLLIVWQVFINEEMLLLTALATMLAVGVWAAMSWQKAREQARRFVTAGLIAVGVAIVPLAYPIWFQFRGRQSYDGIPHAFANWGENIAAFFSYSRDTLAGTPGVENTLGITEQNSWYGVPLVLFIIVVAVVMWRRSLVARVATVVGVTFALFGLGPTIHVAGRDTSIPGPWKLVEHVPLVSFMVPSRLIYVVTACIAVVLALACEHIPKLTVVTAPVRLRTAWYVMLAVVLVPLIPTPMPSAHTPNVPAFISDGGWRQYVDEEHTLATVPLPDNVTGLHSLLWQAVAGQEYRQPQGYFLGPDHEGHGRFGAVTTRPGLMFEAIANTGRVPRITESIRSEFIADLRRWRTAVLVVDPTRPHAEELRQAVSELTGITPMEVGGAWVWDVRPIVDGGGE